MTLLKALRTGTWGSSALILVACAILVFCGILTWGIFGAVVSGLIAGVVIGYSTEYYTSDEYKPTKELAAQAQHVSGASPEWAARTSSGTTGRRI